MRIALTADLHFVKDSPREAPVKELAKAIKHHNPDILVIAGDIGESLQSLENVTACLKIFSDVAEVRCALAGNHDLWCAPDSPLSSKSLWENELPTIARELQYYWLDTQNVVVGEIAIVGTYLHYDYSAQDVVGPTSSFSKEYFAVNKYKINNDGNFLILSDVEFSTAIANQFLARLQLAQNDPVVKTIIVVTHVPCLECLVTRKPQDFNWSVGTPYFANLSYEKHILACGKVEYVICGHTHKKIRCSVDRGNMPAVQAINIGGDYGAPELVVIDV